MKALEAIAEFDTLRPNSFSQEQKLRWLNRLDSFLIESVHARYPGLRGEIRLSDPNRELLMTGPFSEAYLHWMEAKVHYFNQEIDRYNSAIGMFRGIFEDYQRELHRRQDLPQAQDFH